MSVRERRWATGYLLCLACGEEHLSSWHIGTEPLECPHCAEFMCVPCDGVGFGEAPKLMRTGEAAEMRRKVVGVLMIVMGTVLLIMATNAAFYLWVVPGLSQCK